MTEAEATIIGAAISLASVGIGLFYRARREDRRDREAERRERDGAIAELLTAAADLVTAIQTIRATYDRSRWRGHVRIAARVWSALAAAFADDSGFLTRATLSEMSRRTVFLDQMMVADRAAIEQQQLMVSGIAATMLPRTNRFFAAVASLTLGDDEDLADAVRVMTPAITELIEATAATGTRRRELRLSVRSPGFGRRLTNGTPDDGHRLFLALRRFGEIVVQHVFTASLGADHGPQGQAGVGRERGHELGRLGDSCSDVGRLQADRRGPSWRLATSSNHTVVGGGQIREHISRGLVNRPSAVATPLDVCAPPDVMRLAGSGIATSKRKPWSNSGAPTVRWETPRRPGHP